jgi:hypothetical protein
MYTVSVVQVELDYLVIAIMFCDAEEIKYLRQVTKLIGKEIPLVTDHPYHADIKEGMAVKKPSSSPQTKEEILPKKEII